MCHPVMFEDPDVGDSTTWLEAAIDAQHQTANQD